MVTDGGEAGGMVELVDLLMPVPGGFVGPVLGRFDWEPVPRELWTGVWVALGADDGD